MCENKVFLIETTRNHKGKSEELFELLLSSLKEIDSKLNDTKEKINKGVLNLF